MHANARECTRMHACARMHAVNTSHKHICNLCIVRFLIVLIGRKYGGLLATIKSYGGETLDGGLCVIVEVAGPFVGHATVASSQEGGAREKHFLPIIPYYFRLFRHVLRLLFIG